MGSPDKNRLVVLLLFFVVLITFAMFYRPIDAQSHAAGQTHQSMRHRR